MPANVKRILRILARASMQGWALPDEARRRVTYGNSTIDKEELIPYDRLRGIVRPEIAESLFCTFWTERIAQNTI